MTDTLRPVAESVDTSPGTVPGADPAGPALIKPGYDSRLTNEDLAPLRHQTWKAYNFFAFWMSDVHSVGGYVTAGSLFALGLAAWQVLIALLVGITIVYFLCNLVARPSTGHRNAVPGGVPHLRSGCSAPTSRRSSVGLIAVAWYGIQTYLASHWPWCCWPIKLWPGTRAAGPTRSASTVSPGSPPSVGSASGSCGSPRPSCSGGAWSRSASSSTSVVPRSTW